MILGINVLLAFYESQLGCGHIFEPDDLLLLLFGHFFVYVHNISALGNNVTILKLC